LEGFFKDLIKWFSTDSNERILFYFVFLRNWTAGFLRIGTFGFSVNLFSLHLSYLVTITGLNVTCLLFIF